MQFRELYEQLRQRRVIRAAVIYAALFWALLQVMDLLADAEIVSNASVRWMIIIGVAAFPLVLLGSWFLENPWKGRRWLSVAGDILVIVAIAVAAILFVWQQWFSSNARPVVAVLSIEATDTRDDTADLADHLTRRLRMLLATQAEVRVIETESSTHPALEAMTLIDKAAALNVDFLLTGTLSRGGDDIRLSLQLRDDVGELLWSEGFENRLTDQVQMQDRLLTELWPQLPLSVGGLAATRNIVADCDYPGDVDSILALARSGHRAAADDGFRQVAASRSNGLLSLEQARRLFAEIPARPPAQRPVLQSVAMQKLAVAEEYCVLHPGIELLRIENTRMLVNEGTTATRYLAIFPNSSSLYLQLADAFLASGASGAEYEFLTQALELNPASSRVLCRLRSLLKSTESDTARIDASIASFVSDGCEQG